MSDDIEAWLREIRNPNFDREGFLRDYEDTLRRSPLKHEEEWRLLALICDLQAQVKYLKEASDEGEVMLSKLNDEHFALQTKLQAARADLERYKKGWHELQERVLAVVQNPRDEEQISRLT